MSAVVGHCPNCNRSVLVDVREWHILDGIGVLNADGWSNLGVTPDCCIYADCPHCGGDVDQYEGAS